MNIFKMRSIRVFTFSAILIIATVVVAVAQGNDGRSPELPVGCEHLAAPEGHEVAFKVYATGVQVYRWDGTSWAFIGPLAKLYADAGYRGKVGTHYAGPTWKSNSGSLVIGKNALRCTPDPDSIPWLRLEAHETDGAGIFNGVTYIQRINTSGGKAPVEPGTFDSEEVSVPYTTEYYFYKAQY